MSGYIIPPRTSPNDYAIGVSTQDELLRAAVANDANIARARKLQRKGEVEQLLPRQKLSVEERLRNEGIQEAEARSNLMRIGFRDQEAADIVIQMDRDERATLNGAYPEIKRDIQANYDVGLMTVSFFLSYFRRFKHTLMAARGVSFYGAGSGEDSLINSVDELSALIPTKNQLTDFAARVSTMGVDVRPIMYWRDRMTPDMDTVRQLDDDLRLPYIQDLLKLSQKAGSISRNQTQTLLDTFGRKTETDKLYDIRKMTSVGAYYMNRGEDMVRELERLRNISTSVGQSSFENRETNTEPLRSGFDEFDVGKTGDVDSDEEIESREPLEYEPSNKPRSSDIYRDELESLLRQFQEDDSAVNFKRIKDKMGETGYILPAGVAKARFSAQPFVYINQAVAAFEGPKTGSGYHKPLKMKVGRGLSVKKSPAYREFGKYAINIPQLENNDTLVIKYKSMGPVPKFKPTSVSDLFRDFIMDIFENGKPNKRVFSQLDEDERRLFEDMSVGAGLWSSFGLKRTTTSQEQIDDKDFELLRGEYLAGNNNPQVITALRKLTVKLMNNGRLKKSQGMELLMELSV